MPLTPEERSYFEKVLNKCDAALANKPTLASIYNTGWRKVFRESLLKANSVCDVEYPAAYGAPHLTLLPPNYQQRMEEGARILLSRLDNGDSNHLIERFRGCGSASAEEEVLLARGFAAEFGEDAMLPPQGLSSDRRPEFSVRVGLYEIDIEAKGLLDSNLVRSLWDAARRKGQHGWATANPKIDDVGRIQSAMAKKLLATTPGKPTILVLTQYSGWPSADQTVDLLRGMTANPSAFNIPCSNHPLAMAFVSGWLIQGAWFNAGVLRHLNMDEALLERLRKAIRQSFYPRPDGICFDETLDEESHRRMVARMGS